MFIQYPCHTTRKWSNCWKWRSFLQMWCPFFHGWSDQCCQCSKQFCLHNYPWCGGCICHHRCSYPCLLMVMARRLVGSVFVIGFWLVFLLDVSVYVVSSCICITASACMCEHGVSCLLFLPPCPDPCCSLFGLCLAWLDPFFSSLLIVA